MPAPVTVAPVLHNPPVRSALESRVADHCRRHGLLPAGRPVLAMVSGGADSTCLMHLLTRIHDGPVGRAGRGPRAARGLAARGRGGARRRRRARPDRPRRAPRHGCGRGRSGAGPGGAHAGRRPRGARARLRPHRDRAHGVRPGRDGPLPPRARHRPHRRARHGAAPRGARAAPALRVGRRDAPLVRRAGPGGRSRTRPTPTPPTPARGCAPGSCRPWRRSTRAPRRTSPPWRTILRDEAELLEPLVEGAWGRVSAGPGLDPAALAAEPRAMRRLLARRLIAEAGLAGDALGAAPVARALETAADGRPSEPAGRGRGGPGGRSPRGLRPGRPGPRARRRSRCPARPPSATLVVRAAAGPAVAPAPDRVAVRLEGDATVRSPRPGDRLALPGGGRRAVGRLLADAGVPARLRHLVPVVAPATGWSGWPATGRPPTS